MGRVTATAVHLVLWVLAGALYFLFVLPRWWELMGDTSHSLGTVLRIVTGVLFALATLPALLMLLGSREPERGTPQLALRLRLSAVILHLLAGVLIAVTAVVEIWVSLDRGGPWLFGVYGAAAAIAVLGLLAFQLAFTAELPAKAPKPKKEKKNRRGTKAAADEPETATEDSQDSADSEDDAGEISEPAAAEEIEESAAVEEPAMDAEAGGLRNKRPTGKTNRRLRRRDRVTVVDESE